MIEPIHRASGEGGDSQRDLAMLVCSHTHRFLLGFALPQATTAFRPVGSGFGSCRYHVEHEHLIDRIYLKTLQKGSHQSTNRITIFCMSKTPAQGEADGMEATEQEKGIRDSEKGIYGYDQEVVDREAAESPFRRLRLIAYGVFAVSALALGCVSLAGLAGVEQFKEVSQNLPNPLLDAGVIGLTFYLWVEEVKTKRSALLLMEKRRQEELRVPNRSTRRQKQGNKQQSKLSAAGTTPAAESSAPSNPAGDAGPSAGPGPGSADVASASREPRDVRDPSGEEQQGMFAGIRKTLEDVNQQSYYQALALNKELEEKGILPPLERKQEEAAPASEVQQEVDSRSRKGGTEGEDAGGKIIDIVDDGAGVDGRGTSVGERAQGGPKQRRKPRGARKDKRKR